MCADETNKDIDQKRKEHNRHMSDVLYHNAKAFCASAKQMIDYADHYIDKCKKNTNFETVTFFFIQPDFLNAVLSFEKTLKDYYSGTDYRPESTCHFETGPAYNLNTLGGTYWNPPIAEMVEAENLFNECSRKLYELFDLIRTIYNGPEIKTTQSFIDYDSSYSYRMLNSFRIWGQTLRWASHFVPIWVNPETYEEENIYDRDDTYWGVFDLAEPMYAMALAHVESLPQNEQLAMLMKVKYWYGKSSIPPPDENYIVKTESKIGSNSADVSDNEAINNVRKYGNLEILEEGKRVKWTFNPPLPQGGYSNIVSDSIVLEFSCEGAWAGIELLRKQYLDSHDDYISIPKYKGKTSFRNCFQAHDAKIFKLICIEPQSHTGSVKESKWKIRSPEEPIPDINLQKANELMGL